MNKESFRKLIIEKMKQIDLDYEDFIGYSYSNDPKVWIGNLTVVLPDTYHYSRLTNDTARMQLVKDTLTELIIAYKTLDLEEGA